MNLKQLKYDLPAGVVVFLVALPLCLGIALASGAPLMSGIISGIIGGIVVGVLSGSSTSVSGPAAGLAAVVLSSIHQLGAFEILLTAIILAGMMQIIMGIFKAGIIADFIPNNVIKGLLASIGIILILKQLPHAVGFDRDAEGDFSFFQMDGENTLSELKKALLFFSPGAILISTVSIFILLTWEKMPWGKFRFLPASLAVVLLGVLLQILFSNYFPGLAIAQEHLVNIPKPDLNELGSFIHLPDLSVLGNPSVWTVAVTLAVIASLETILNIEAIDKIDPQKRISPPNMELLAQGAGNILAGFLGGLPVTSVIVRSSVNIQSGNASKASAIIHGFLILLSILFFAPLINLIPLAALASILILTGYKLAKISIFKDLYKKGPAQFVPFLVTVLAIIFTDLLIGVLVGLAVSIFFLLRSNFRNPLTKEEYKFHIGEVMKLELPSQVSFFNKASIHQTLWSIPEGSKVMIDVASSDYIDDDVLEVIMDFKNVVAPEKNIKLNIIGLKDKYALIDHIQFVTVLDKATQSSLTPNRILDLLKLGNERFVKGKWNEKQFLHQVNATAMGQNPMAVLVGCIDSRTSPEILFDAGIGDLLTVRIAGNIINPEIIGSIEIAVKKLGAKLIVVKGHSKCGAVALAMQDIREEKMYTVTDKIRQVASGAGLLNIKEGEDVNHVYEQVTIANARNSMLEILQQSPYIFSKVQSGEIGIVSAYHDIATGQVIFDPMGQYQD